MKWSALIPLLTLLIAACGSSAIDDGQSTTTTGQPQSEVTVPQDGETTLPQQSSETTTAGAVVNPDIPLVPASELPDDFPPVPVPAGGEPADLGVFGAESVILEYPSGTLPTLIAFYEAWLVTQDIEPEPMFGSVWYWEGTVDGTPVEIEIFATTNDSGDRLAITYYP